MARRRDRHQAQNHKKGWKGPTWLAASSGDKVGSPDQSLLFLAWFHISWMWSSQSRGLVSGPQGESAGVVPLHSPINYFLTLFDLMDTFSLFFLNVLSFEPILKLFTFLLHIQWGRCSIYSLFFPKTFQSFGPLLSLIFYLNSCNDFGGRKIGISDYIYLK